MDRRTTLQDIVVDALSHCELRGPTRALGLLMERIPTKEIESSEYLQALVSTCKSASAAEKNKMRRTIEELSGFGIALPRDVLFFLGIPRREFGLKVNFLNGRLGDTLDQLAKLVHGMHALNLILFVNCKLSKNRSIMLSCTDCFNEEFNVYDGDEGTLRDYVLEVASKQDFSLTLLRGLNTSLFSKLPTRESIHISSESIVVHVRAGDALFIGALFLPPLNYYIDAISNSKAKNVVIVCEPENPQDLCVNPVPGLIQSFCRSANINCVIQSSDKIEMDAATLFYAKNVIASNSSFSKWLPLYGPSCESLTIPNSIDGEKRWVQDKCITYVDCWNAFNQEKWRDSLDYRLGWVSGKL